MMVIGIREIDKEFAKTKIGKKFSIGGEIYICKGITKDNSGNESYYLQKYGDESVTITQEYLWDEYREELFTIPAGVVYYAPQKGLVSATKDTVVDKGKAYEIVTDVNGNPVRSGRYYYLEDSIFTNYNGKCFVFGRDFKWGRQVWNVCYNGELLYPIPDGFSFLSGEKIQSEALVRITSDLQVKVDVSDVPNGYLESSISGIYFHPSDNHFIDNEFIVSDYDIINKLSNEYAMCEDCGKINLAKDFDCVDGHYFCKGIFKEPCEKFVCDECGEEKSPKGMKVVHNKNVCSDCIESEYVWCSLEREYEYWEDAESDENADYYTAKNADKYIKECMECGRVYPIEQMYKDDDTGDYYCRTCSESVGIR